MVTLMKDISESYRCLAASAGLYRRSSSRNSRGGSNPLARCSSAPAALPPLHLISVSSLKLASSEMQNSGPPPFGEAVEAASKPSPQWDKAALVKIQESVMDVKVGKSTMVFKDKYNLIYEHVCVHSSHMFVEADSVPSLLLYMTFLDRLTDPFQTCIWSVLLKCDYDGASRPHI